MSRLAPGLAREDLSWRRSRKAGAGPNQGGLLAGIIGPDQSTPFERADKLAHKTVIERLVAVVRSKHASPTWNKGMKQIHQTMDAVSILKPALAQHMAHSEPGLAADDDEGFDIVRDHGRCLWMSL
jgi:hypothetical protein